MIRVINKWEQDLNTYSSVEDYGASLGDGVLTPSRCTVSETAGGSYSLKLVHPIDEAGLWRLIEPFSLICAPIPETSTPMIDPGSGTVIGVGMQVWQTTNDETYLYSASVYRYRAWIRGEAYFPGDRVSHNSYNWECTKVNNVEPAAGVSQWRKIGLMRPVMRVLGSGVQFITDAVPVSDAGTYYIGTLIDGTAGAIRITSLEYLYTIDEDSPILDVVSERHLDHQLFRVTDVQIDGSRRQLTATAQHVSYDWSMAIIGQTSLKDATLPTAIAAIRSAVLPDGASSAPYIYAEESENTITAACTRKSLTSILLDPEEGLVAQAKARLVRDERDFFLLADSETDRGFSIRYGVNLTGVTWQRDYSKMVTRVMPVAKASDGTDYLLPVTAGETWPYVDSPLREQYPVDMYQALQVDAKIGDDGTEAEVQQKMVEEAEKRYTEDKADLPATTLEVEFLMLGDTEEYAQYRGLEQLTLYDTVEIIHPDIGLSTRAQVKSYEWDALEKRYTKITLGDPFEAAVHTVYGYNVADGAITARKLTPEAIEEIRNG